MRNFSSPVNGKKFLILCIMERGIIKEHIRLLILIFTNTMLDFHLITTL